MDLLDRIYKQKQKIKREKKMIPTELGNKIIRNFKVPARNNKHVIKRYTKTSKHNNKLHKKGDIKLRRIKDYDDFINNYDVILKIYDKKNNVHNDTKTTQNLKKKCNIYKHNFNSLIKDLIHIQKLIGAKNIPDITAKIDKKETRLSKHDNLFNNLCRRFGVSNSKQLLAVIQNLQDNRKSNQNNDQDNSTSSDSDGSNQSDDDSQYHFGEIE